MGENRGERGARMRAVGGSRGEPLAAGVERAVLDHQAQDTHNDTTARLRKKVHRQRQQTVRKDVARVYTSSRKRSILTWEGGESAQPLSKARRGQSEGPGVHDSAGEDVDSDISPDRRS